MKRKRISVILGSLFAATAFSVVNVPAFAATTYGTLDNFDVINDTGDVCHGFEIELEGISSSDVAYTFGAPYQRYGEPTIVPTATGVIVRYASAYQNGVWAATTPVPTIQPDPATLGHMCWTSGDPNEMYWDSGCEHFGMSLNRNPTKTTYRWLVENATQPGTLTPFGSNVAIPAPVWNVTPQPEAPPVVVAVVQAPPLAPEAPAGQWGEPVWVKIFKTEIPNALNAEDLNALVLDAPGADIVPNEPVETEIEWMLLQAAPAGMVGANEESENGGEIAPDSEAVSRRYEFYKYLGPVNPEDGEARCDNPDNCPGAVGDFIGAQNVALNIAGAFDPPPVAGNQAPVAQCMDVTALADLGGCSAAASVDFGSYDPDGDPIIISQAPAGPFGTGITPVALNVVDDKGAATNCSASVTVLDQQAPVLTVPASATVEATGPAGAAVTFNALAASDNCAIAASGCTPASGSTFPLGSTTVNCTAADPSGNAGTASFAVTVKDTTAPSVTAPAAISVPATEAGGTRGSASAVLAAFLAGGAASDAVDPAPVRQTPQVAGANADTSTLFPIGTTPVSFRYTDASGNTGTATSNVTVSVGQPKLAATVMAQGRNAAGLYYVTLDLRNTGSGNARNLSLSKVVPKTLAGKGRISYVSPTLPLTIGNLDAGTTTTVTLYLKVPTTVTRFSLTESATARDVTGTSYPYSLTQTLTP